MKISGTHEFAHIAGSSGQLSLSFYGRLLILDFVRQVLDSELLSY
jgi:hypothetical protein